MNPAPHPGACPKCGGTQIEGPHSRSSYRLEETHVPPYRRHVPHEVLEYTCACGYAWTTPTRDAHPPTPGRTTP